MQNLNQPMAYQFNGIEKVDNFGLGVNMAHFRTLDPAVGRWWSVDPAAEVLAPMSPYCAMNGSPLLYSDPRGDIPPLIIGAAIIGGGLNLWSNWGDVTGVMDGLSYFTSGAVGGGVGVVNPHLGMAITSFGNLATDFSNGTLSKLDSPVDVVSHFAFTALEGVGAAGAGELAKGISTVFNLSWHEFGRIGQLSALEIQMLANEGIALTTTLTAEKVAAATVSKSTILKSTAANVASGAGQGGKKIALGITDGGKLYQFANQIGAETYLQFGQSADDFIRAVNNTKNSIHFRLDVTTRINGEAASINLQNALRSGNVPTPTYGNITNWEIHKLASNKEWLSRTTFYSGGQPINTPKILLGF